jgi:peptidoglycan/LPS O-acetylase OafA/YrhL
MRTPDPAGFPAEGSPYARHIPALDGIRGLAVLGVAGSHLFPGTPHGAVTFAIAHALSFGASGVDLFFVLSGFLITGILFDSLGDGHFFQKFYARRVLRIFPLYYAVIGLYALGALLLGMRYNRELISLALYLQNTSWIAPPIYAYNGPSNLPLSHFWSLAIEE